MCFFWRFGVSFHQQVFTSIIFCYNNESPYQKPDIPCFRRSERDKKTSKLHKNCSWYRWWTKFLWTSWYYVEPKWPLYWLETAFFVETQKQGTNRFQVYKSLKTIFKKKTTLQGTNISHLGKRKIIFKMPFLGDMLVPSLEGIPRDHRPGAFPQATKP